MKIKEYIAPTILFILIIASGYFFNLYQRCEIFDPGLPDGYHLLCSFDHKYTLTHKSFGGGISANTWDTIRKVKNYAWTWERGEHLIRVWESDKYEWKECE